MEELDYEEGEPITNLPEYIPLWKGKMKVTKDLYSGKFMVSTPLLPEQVIFEGAFLAHNLVLKMEDWDLADHAKFPHLEIPHLMKPKENTAVGVTELEPQKWLHGVEKVGLLNLLLVPHFHRAPITIFIIRQSLCLMHDGFLWLEEPIPIMEDLIHSIS